jgi:hypothetical protein
LENIFRSVNIALVNELKVVYEAMGIDVHEVNRCRRNQTLWLYGISSGPGFGWALASRLTLLLNLESKRVWQAYPLY